MWEKDIEAPAYRRTTASARATFRPEPPLRASSGPRAPPQGPFDGSAPLTGVRAAGEGAFGDVELSSGVPFRPPLSHLVAAQVEERGGEKKE